MNAASLLRWYIDAGVDETVGETPRDCFAPPPARPAAPPPAPFERPATAPAAQLAAPMPLAPAPFQAATALAQACKSFDELKAAVEAFDGCALKRTATKTVFADGNPESKILFLGEAPGADEDRIGLPFVGVSGQLLDKMLASIGLDRSSVLISNVIYWRPPGNRTPEPAEVMQCLPFVERLIEIVEPAMIVLLGGSSAKAVLATQDSIGRLRGRWHDRSVPGLPHPVPVLATFHPSYLLRTPMQKRLAWQDFLAIRKRMDALGEH